MGVPGIAAGLVFQRFQVVHKISVIFCRHVLLPAHGHRHPGLFDALFQLQGLPVIRLPSLLWILEKQL